MDAARKIKRRLNLIFLGALLIGLCIIIRICYLQYVEGGFWKEKAKEKTLQTRAYRASRGNICAMDAETGHMHFMAINKPIYDIYVDFGEGMIRNPKTKKMERGRIVNEEVFRKQLKPLCDSLGKLFVGQPRAKTSRQYQEFLTREYKKRNRYVEIRKGISKDELERLKYFPILGTKSVRKEKGRRRTIYLLDQSVVNLTPRSVRIYPYGDLARRTIGISIDHSDTSFNGIDGYFAPFLAGEEGVRVERRIGPGLWVPVNSQHEFLIAKDGSDVISSIDIKLQELAENSLKQCLELNNAASGCVILMEVKTGYIKAISSLTQLPSGRYSEIQNIAISDLLEPGSTFKTVTAMMMIDKGLIDTALMVPSGEKFFPRTSKPIRDVGFLRNEEISFRRAMEKSSNVGISEVIYNTYHDQRLQLAKDLKEYFPYERLNLAIDVHEPKPVINDSTRFMDDILRLGFGYVSMMTPLQLLTFYNGVANNGKVMKPQFVTEIRHANKVFKTFPPLVIREQMCQNKETIAIIQDILKRVVLYGTGRRLAGTSYGIAGKSGTAEIGYNKRDERLEHRASFVGYFPADDPKYSCIVMISKPQRARTHGGDLAAPVFKNLSDRVVGSLIHSEIKAAVADDELKLPSCKTNASDLYHLLDKMEMPFSASTTEQQWVVTGSKENDTLQIESMTIHQNRVPNVRGMTIKDAIYLLENMGLEVSFSGRGRVRVQSLAPQSGFVKGNKIHLSLQSEFDS